MRRNLRITARAAAVAAAVTALMGVWVGFVLGQTTFNDVPESDQRSADIDYAAAQRWFQGYPDGSFRPDRPISEEQLARVIRRAHPGMTRGDAAVFLRGGIDRLQAAGITPAATAAAATTTTLPAGEPGGAGPGEPGAVDPNPPVVIEGATTTTTTTTAQPSGRTLAYGKEDGWSNNRGVSGAVVWWEFRNWDEASQSSTLVTDYGGKVLIGDEDEPYPYWFRSVRTDFSIVQAGCNVTCTTLESSAMPDSIRNLLEAAGYTEPSAVETTTTTTTTTLPADTATTTTTTAPPGPDVPDGVGERNVVRYGFETGWTNSDGPEGSLFWVEFGIRDERPLDDAILSNWWQNNGSARFTITGRDSNGQTITRTLSTSSNPTRFYPFDIQRVSATCNHGCTPEGDMPMPGRARTWAGQFGYSTTTTTTTTAPATAQPSGRTLVYGKEDGWSNSRGVSGAVVWWEFRNWDSSPKDSTLITDYGGTLLIGAEDEPYPYWFKSGGTGFSIVQAGCDVTCTAMESAAMPDSIRNRLKANSFTEPSG